MLYKIGQVAQQVELSIKRIREYEKEGLIKPVRGQTSNQRLYGPFEISRIVQIKRLIHERGLTVAGIRTLLSLAPCWTVFDCREPSACPAYHDPYHRCWEVRKDCAVEVLCMGECEKCAIYLAHIQEVPPLFEKTPAAEQA